MAGIAHFPQVNSRIDFPPISSYYIIKSDIECEVWRGRDIKVGSNAVVVYLKWNKLLQQEAFELVVALGVSIGYKDFAVVLYFSDKSFAYSAFRFLAKSRVYSTLFLPNLKLCDSTSLELFLTKRKAVETYREGEEGYPQNVKNALYYLELEHESESKNVKTTIGRSDRSGQKEFL